MLTGLQGLWWQKEAWEVRPCGGDRGGDRGWHRGWLGVGMGKKSAIWAFSSQSLLLRTVGASQHLLLYLLWLLGTSAAPVAFASCCISFLNCSHWHLPLNRGSQAWAAVVISCLSLNVRNSFLSAHCHKMPAIVTDNQMQCFSLFCFGGLSASSSLALWVPQPVLITSPSSSRSFSQGIFPGAQTLIPQLVKACSVPLSV